MFFLFRNFLLILLSLTLFPAAVFAEKTFTVGFAQDTMSNDWRAAQVHDLQNEFKKYRNINFFYTNAEGSTARQINDIENMIKRKVDLIITSPRDSKLMDKVITKAYKSGIPVVLISRRVTSNNFTSFIHPSNYNIAKKAAIYISKNINNEGKILILQHTKTTTPAQERTRGFFDVINKNKNIKVINMIEAHSDRALALNAVEEILDKGEKFDAIYAQSDSMAIGAVLALKKKGLDPAKYTITGIDYITEAKHLIKKGYIKVSFTYPTGGAEGAEIANKILNGRKVNKEYIIPSKMITIENADKVDPIF